MLILAMAGAAIAFSYFRFEMASSASITTVRAIDGVGVSGDAETRKVLNLYNNAFSEFWGDTLLWSCRPSLELEMYRVVQFDDVDAGRDFSSLLEFRITPTVARKVVRTVVGWTPDSRPHQIDVRDFALTSNEADSIRNAATKLIQALSSSQARDKSAKGVTGLIDSGAFVESCRRGNYSFFYQHAAPDAMADAAYSQFVSIALKVGSSGRAQQTQ